MSILLPKQYLSWSSFSLWQSNKDRYKKMYFENSEPLDTKYLRFGKSIASSIEDGTYIGSLPNLVVYPVVEFKINTKIGDVDILSYIDSYDPEKNIFREYKTGKIPWTQAKVQKHGQLLFYAVALRAITGIAPQHCHLDWIETKEVESSGVWDIHEKKVELTGKILTFFRELDERELDRMEQEIINVAQEISKEYRKFISEL